METEEGKEEESTSSPAQQTVAVGSGSRWRHWDSLFVFFGLVLMLTSICGQDGDLYRATHPQDMLWTSGQLLIVYLFWTKLQKELQHDVFDTSPEPRDAVSELGQQASLEQVHEERISADSSTQTDGRNFLLEAKRLENNHRREMRRLTRQTLCFRRHMQVKLKESNSQIRDLARELDQEQHDLLPLISRKKSLLEEKDALENQLREEEWRRQDLAERFNQVDIEISCTQTDASHSSEYPVKAFQHNTLNHGHGDGRQINP